MDKVTCKLCGESVHYIQKHLTESHEGEMTLDGYKAQFPDAPLMSEKLRKAIEAQKVEKVREADEESKVTPVSDGERGGFSTMTALYGIDFKTKTGGEIKVSIGDLEEKYDYLIPQDPNFAVLDIPLIKNIHMCLEVDMPMLVFGHMGLGKTKNIEMVCAKTKRPAIRVNHSMNMSEYDVLGMEGVKKHISDDGQVVSFTEFVPGPLAEAFKYGWVYIADEYDRAHPMVLSVYQAVLEGADKLIIKHASGDWRVVYRHPNFRFMATGNTNGSGDDTGLYLGTTNQDAANMERFAVTHRVTWMDQKSEIAILVQSLKLRKDDATRLVKFANKIRNLVEQGRVSLPIGSRVLSNMALIGKKKGSFIEGITLAYANRLPETERDAAIQAATQEFES